MPNLTLEEKVALVSGASFWTTVAIQREGIRSITLSDGPHGLRTPAAGGDNLGLGESIPATCFPPAVGIASSWNRELVRSVAEAIGREARTEGVAVVLGPGINIKRSPLCGRNFEYFSEDPFVSGELGAAYVRGVQSQGVGAALKHFAANNQETNRMTVNVEADERTLREIYLSAFETVITREQPWTVMCSYNRINGVYAAENHWLLTDVLRNEWGFDGLVVSDWGAVDDRVRALAAGTDLEMPGPVSDSFAAIVSAIKTGKLAEATLDTAVSRILRLGNRAPDRAADYDVDAHHFLARRAAAESIVLLRNEGAVLPLERAARVAVVGEFARSPRIQGSGSSQVNPTRVDTPLDSLAALGTVSFAPGYSFNAADDQASLRADAVALAKESAIALLFVGLPSGAESEGYDRTTIELPGAQLELIAEVAAVNPQTIVVLTNGGVVSLEPWHDSVAAILECWLLGQGGGSAIADVVFGVTSPSGRLAESIPFRIQDTPAYLNFPGEGDVVRYGEGIFVGYRYFETADVAVRYPFGHGLTYTTFDYSALEVSLDGMRASVRVTNTGAVEGSEVVQLYVSASSRRVRSPRRQLREFAKVTLAPGESTLVQFALSPRSFSFFDVILARWIVEAGEYRVQIAKSAHEIVLEAAIRLKGNEPIVTLTMESPVADWLAHPVTGPLFRRASGEQPIEGGAGVLEMVSSMSMRRLLRFPNIPLKASQLRILMRIANNRIVRGIARRLEK